MCMHVLIHSEARVTAVSNPLYKGKRELGFKKKRPDRFNEMAITMPFCTWQFTKKMAGRKRKTVIGRIIGSLLGLTAWIPFAVQVISRNRSGDHPSRRRRERRPPVLPRLWADQVSCGVPDRNIPAALSRRQWDCYEHKGGESGITAPIFRQQLTRSKESRSRVIRVSTEPHNYG